MKKLILLSVILIVGCEEPTEPDIVAVIEDSCSMNVEVEYCSNQYPFCNCKTAITNTGIDTLYGFGYTFSWVLFHHTTVDTTIIVEGIYVSGTVDISDTTIIEGNTSFDDLVDPHSWFLLPDSTMDWYHAQPSYADGFEINCQNMDSLQFVISNLEPNCSNSPLPE